MPKNFERVAAVPKKKKRADLKVVPKQTEMIVNLNQVDLNDRENWLRALDICTSSNSSSIDSLLSEIEQYQGQIDQSLRTAQAQSTIYAYAIGSRLDTIENNQLYLEKGYENLTKFIQAGEVKRPSGEPITTRQVWSYRRVTRGLNEFLQVAEAIRDGEELTDEVQENLETISGQLNQDIVESFLHSYAETITGVLELGVSKLDQVYRLPSPLAVSGLLAGKLPLDNDVVEVDDISFSDLRKAISVHENKGIKKSTKSNQQTPTQALGEIEQALNTLRDHSLKANQKRKLGSLIKKLDSLLND